MNKVFLCLGLIAFLCGQAFSASTLNSETTCLGAGNGMATIYFDNYGSTVVVGAVVTNPMSFSYEAKSIPAGSGLVGDASFPDPSQRYRANFAGFFQPITSGSYIFKMLSDDGDIVYFDGFSTIIDYSSHPARETSAPAAYLHAGQKYFISIDYFQNIGTSNVTVSYSLNSGAFTVIDHVLPCAFAPTALTQSCSSAASGSQFHFFNGITRADESYTSPYVGSTTASVANLGPSNGTPFFTGFPFDNFSLKWTAALVVPTTGRYRFAINSYVSNFSGIKIGEITLTYLQFTGSLSQQEIRITPPVYLEAGKAYSFELSFVDAGTSFQARASLSVSFNEGSFNSIPLTYLKDCQNYGVVTPYRVSIATAKTTSIPVRLRTPPTGKVTVTVAPHAGVTVSTCVLYFDQTNWNIPQYVAAVNTNDGDLVDFAVSSSVDPNYNGTPDSGSTTKILGTPTSSGSGSAVVGAMCTSWGDPHMITFDGRKYDNFAVGDYYLVRTLDSNFVVQARQGACGSGAVACNYGLAIKFNDAVWRVFFKPTGQPYYDGNFQSGFYGSVVSYDSPSRRYTFTLPNNYKVTARIDWWAKGKTWYISAYIEIPTDACTPRGLCGNFDSNPANDFMLKSGALASTQNQFISEYSAPSGESLFVNADNTIPTLSGVETCNAIFTNCTVDPNPPPPACTGSSCVPPPPPGCVTNCTCDITLTEADTFCTDTFITNGPAAGCTGINVTTLVENCKIEVIQMCDYNAATPGIEYYTKECCLTDPGICPPCDSNCNGNGNCVSGSCSCDPGYSGPSCVPDGTPCTTAATPSNPGATATQIVLTGAFYPSGKSVSCIFTASDLVTIRQTTGFANDEFTVTCPLPSLPALANGVYTVTIQYGLISESCGATITKSGSATLDPHFFGFNGEKMEVKKDDNAANQIYHLFCSESITISTLFYEYPDKLLFMTRFWVRLGETMFTLNLSPVPKMVTAHEPATFLPELGRFRIEIPEGHLEWDDSKLRVVYKYLRISFSNHVYLNGDAYMNIDFSGIEVPTENKISGIIGRTVYNRLTNDEFAQYEQYRGSVSDVISFTCPL